MMPALGKIYCIIVLVTFISTTVEGIYMYPCSKKKGSQTISGVTAGSSQKGQEGSGEGDPSCLQLKVLRGRDGRDGRDGERGIPGERGEKGAQGRAGEKGQKGQQGVQGITGPAGSVMNCGQIYVRWGRTTCTGNQSTELVYSGRAGGSWYGRTGGATNYLCMPDNPDYLQYDSDVEGPNYVYGVEYNPVYGQPLRVNPNVNGHNVPCAVCMAVSRCSLLMIPGKTSCPVSWTTEYVGYLMSGYQTHALPRTYECVDKDPESVPGLNAVGWDSGSGIFSHVEASCNGMACPPYVAGRELTCVVCTH